MKLEMRTDLLPSAEKDPLESVCEGAVVGVPMETVLVGTYLSTYIKLFQFLRYLGVLLTIKARSH